MCNWCFQDLAVCYTCQQRVKTLHRLLHFKWKIYVAVYSRICDMLGELAPNQFYMGNELMNYIMNDWYWQGMVSVLWHNKIFCIFMFLISSVSCIDMDVLSLYLELPGFSNRPR
jgi:hypothetical protein